MNSISIPETTLPVEDPSHAVHRDSPESHHTWRREDTRFITGAASYLADRAAPGMLHAAFVRSPHAHANISHIDVSAALARRGVVAAITAVELGEFVNPIRAPYDVSSYIESDYPALADGRVRFVGEAVVLVVAETAAAAEEAVSEVTVDYSPLPVVDHIESLLVDAGSAPTPNVVDDGISWRMDEKGEYGDLEGAVNKECVSVEDVFRSQRLAASPLECRGALVDYDRGTGRFTIITGTQVPVTIRFGLAECFNIDEDRVRVIVPDMGGGFGNKTALDPELVALSVAARITDRPVRWIEERSENMTASTHGQEERVWLRLWADTEGHFLGLESDVVVDGGAYSSYPDTPCNEAMNCAMSMVGSYRITNYNFRTRVAITNTCPNGAYRGVARPQANFALERLIDELAIKLGQSPIELRRRNLILSSEMPYRTVTGLERDSGDYAGALDAAVESVQSWLNGLHGEGRSNSRLGFGVSCFAEEGAWGTKRRIPKRNYSIPGYDGARICMNARGGVTVYVSAVSSGQGHETAFAQLAADTIGVRVETVSVRQGDTDLCPYGHGSTGSRSAVSTGGAVIKASEALRRRLLGFAADEFGVPSDVDSLELRDGVVRSIADPDRVIAVEDLAWIAYRRVEPADRDRDPGLEAIAYYDPPDHGVSAFSVHAVVVSIDIDTGSVSILKYVVVEDAGRLLDRNIVDGQIRGGVAQGIGKTLTEELIYDKGGEPLTVGFASYLLPTSMEVPEIDIIHMCSPSPLTLGGIKGCGESGIIGTPAAVGNAIADAFQGMVRPNHLPYTPERVWRWIKAAQEVGVADNATDL